MKNIALLVLLLWVGGVVFVSVGMGILRAIDFLENDFD